MATDVVALPSENPETDVDRYGNDRDGNQRASRSREQLLEATKGGPVWIVVDPLQLADLVRQAVEDALYDRPSEPEWMDRFQVAKLLGYKPSYIAELVRRRGLPGHRVGRKLRFRRDEIEDWMVSNGSR